MDGEKALFTFRREHEQFDLAALNEVDHLVLIATGVDVGVSRNLDGHENLTSRAAMNHAIARLNPVCSSSLLNHGSYVFFDASG